MNKRPKGFGRGLGRGLDALLGQDAETQETADGLRMLSVARLQPGSISRARG